MRTKSILKQSCTLVFSVILGIQLLTFSRCASTGNAIRSLPSASWKTYNNEMFGYQVQYPADWEVIDAVPRPSNKAFEAKYILIENELQKVTFIEKDNQFWPGEFQISVLSNPGHVSLERWIEDYDVEDVGGGSLIQEKHSSTLSGKPAFQLTVFGFDHQETDVISTTDSGEILYLSFEGQSPNDPQFKIHLRIYKRMLGSFRFMKK